MIAEHSISFSWNHLSDEKVRSVLDLRSHGWLQRQIAAKLGVGQPMVSMILSRKNWKHVSSDRPQPEAQ
jgi:predicted transcriptional regulator